MERKGGNGFTLIEVLVASSLLALFMAGLYQVMAIGFSVWDRGQAKIDEQQNIRTAVNHIAREIRTASSWDIGEKGPSDLPADTIEMKIPDAEDLETYRSIRYYLRGKNILRNVNGSGHNVVAYGIKDLRFSGDHEHKIITVSVEGESGSIISTKAFVRADKSFLFSE